MIHAAPFQFFRGLSPPSPPARRFPVSTSASVSPETLAPVKTTAPDSPETAFWDYQYLFVSQRKETASPVKLRTVDGDIPPDFPAGTYYLAGPGIFSDDHGSTVHPLDGHGYLRGFSFECCGKGVEYSARYVRSEAQREERDEETGRWKFTHRGPFSVLRAGKKLGNMKVMKNVANTSALVWGERLLCLWEGGKPYELDSKTLDTVGIFDVPEHDGHDDDDDQNTKMDGGNLGFGGFFVDVAAAVLKPLLWRVLKMPEKRMLSHYRVDARRERLIMLACNAEDMLLPRSNFTFYEFDSSFKLLQKKHFAVEEHLMVHDWAFTENHYVLVGNRIKLNVSGSLFSALSGHAPMISALSVNPSRPTSPIFLFPRYSDSLQRDWTAPIEAPSQQWILHICNAFEEREDSGGTQLHLQASACSYNWFDFQKMFGYDWKSGNLDPSFMNPRKGRRSQLPRLIKVSIRMDRDGNYRECSVQEASETWQKSADFPAINPAFSGRKNEFIFVATTSGARRFLPDFPFDSVAKISCSGGAPAKWTAGRRSFLGEPVFVPRRHSAGEDDGYVLVIEYAVWMRRCYLVILDAKKIGRTESVVAKIEVPKELNFPLGFHGFWAGKHQSCRNYDERENLER